MSSYSYVYVARVIYIAKSLIAKACVSLMGKHFPYSYVYSVMVLVYPKDYNYSYFF